MYHKTRGIVLHCIKYSETSVIAKIYTDKFGLLSFMVKGVRSSKSKAKASLMQPLTMLDMEMAYRENRGLQFIREFRRDYNYESLPFDTLKSTIAIFMLEVIAKSIREHEPNSELFDFIYAALHRLDKTAKVSADFHLLFMLHLSRYLGFAPHDNYSETNCYFEMQEGVFTDSFSSNATLLDKKSAEQIYALLGTSLFEEHTSLLSRTERKQMLTNLLKFYQLHLENFQLKSPEVLEAVLH
ncbi:MAG: DNA repair protein RecO [Chitinophagales bacterium]|nr:DNA repair protein RecO [Chitinophagales bacterium]